MPLETGFMTVGEVSEFLHIPKRTIYEWVNQRRLPHYKLGGTLLRFRIEEIELWAREQRREIEAFVGSLSQS